MQAFEVREPKGRCLRILIIAKVGEDGHDRPGYKVSATGFTDLHETLSEYIMTVLCE